MNKEKACVDFIRLNENGSFSQFSGITMHAGRLPIYNTQTNRSLIYYRYISLYDSVSRKHFNLPVYNPNASSLEKKELFDFISHSEYTSHYVNNAFKGEYSRYLNFVDVLYNTYYKIKTPKAYLYENPFINGFKYGDGLVELSMVGICKCYYVNDSLKMNEFYKNKLRYSLKYNRKWYYYLDR